MVKLGNLPRKKMVKLDFQGFGKICFFSTVVGATVEDDAGGLKLKHDARGATEIPFWKYDKNYEEGTKKKIHSTQKKGGFSINHNVGNTFRYTPEIDSQTPKMTRHILWKPEIHVPRHHILWYPFLSNFRGCGCLFQPFQRTRPSYFPLYWLCNRDPYNG